MRCPLAAIYEYKTYYLFTHWKDDTIKEVYKNELTPAEARMIDRMIERFAYPSEPIPDGNTFYICHTLYPERHQFIRRSRHHMNINIGR